jgi:hypothetical protein
VLGDRQRDAGDVGFLKASVPMDDVGTWPVMHTMGTESMKASASGVTMLVAPGPLVTMATPGLPVAWA